jgi:hypothetical protein
MAEAAGRNSAAHGWEAIRAGRFDLHQAAQRHRRRGRRTDSRGAVAAAAAYLRLFGARSGLDEDPNRVTLLLLEFLDAFGDVF